MCKSDESYCGRHLEVTQQRNQDGGRDITSGFQTSLKIIHLFKLHLIGLVRLVTIEPFFTDFFIIIYENLQNISGVF